MRLFHVHCVRFDYANQYFSYTIQMNANVIAIKVYAAKEVIGSLMNILSLKKKFANNDILGELKASCKGVQLDDANCCT